jgi:FtsP/CotA-like multicopper oxidase with cupredoxin domain
MGPVISATVGDEIQILVKNKLNATAPAINIIPTGIDYTSTSSTPFASGNAPERYL